MTDSGQVGSSSEILVPLAYLVAVVLFIFGLKRQSRVRTARQANGLSALGMLIAVVTTLLFLEIANWEWILGGIVVGGLIGAVAAVRVPMTAMPEMVALFNGSGGAASFLVALAILVPAVPLFGFAPEGQTTTAVWATGTALPRVQLAGDAGGQIALTLVLSIIVGGVTLAGSLVAYGKLAGRVFPSHSIVYPGQNLINLTLLLAMLGGGVYLALFATEPELGQWLAVGVTGLALLTGILLVIPIGGADMPVVISLLNSYSGIAASMTGFVVQNNVLIVSGAMVGAAGLILTNLMCRAMNRSLLNVLMGGFGATSSAAALKGGRDYDESKIKKITAEELALLLDGVSSVVIVPGYGLAVAQAQHACRALAQLLEARDVDVRYGIHPVAGRMPGHMNVLLAEANVPYEQLVEMDEINPELKTTDLAILIGANDVVNPEALGEPGHPLHGMPIINVHEARNVVVVKRSLSPGYAGVKNPLFEYDNTTMFFADAKQALTETLAELKEAS